MTCRVTLWLPAPFVNQGGKRARWREETDIVFCTFCHPGIASQVVGGDTLWSSVPFVNRGVRIRRYQDDVDHSVLIIFKIYAGFYSCRLETFKPNDARDSSLLGRDDQVQWKRFRWRGYWPAEWCSARTKLVSYLYFAFISNKRQVKRGNCHTLISSGDHLFGGMQPSLDCFGVLEHPSLGNPWSSATCRKSKGSIIAQSIKFRNILEVKEGMVA